MKGFLEFKGYGTRMAYDSGTRSFSTVKYDYPNAFCTIGRFETRTEKPHLADAQDQTPKSARGREPAFS
jgi:hypothetical protein